MFFIVYFFLSLCSWVFIPRLVPPGSCVRISLTVSSLCVHEYFSLFWFLIDSVSHYRWLFPLFVFMSIYPTSGASWILRQNIADCFLSLCSWIFLPLLVSHRFCVTLSLTVSSLYVHEYFSLFWFLIDSVSHYRWLFPLFVFMSIYPTSGASWILRQNIADCFLSLCSWIFLPLLVSHRFCVTLSLTVSSLCVHEYLSHVWCLLDIIIIIIYSIYIALYNALL